MKSSQQIENFSVFPGRFMKGHINQYVRDATSCQLSQYKLRNIVVPIHEDTFRRTVGALSSCCSALMVELQAVFQVYELCFQRLHNFETLRGGHVGQQAS